ncbi:hypothetical protein TSOC_006404 [Tetrabaena socialis]|uniref:Uncharacterized protein n=1 Tax=Tetrabaena socialis TaxID=47790 RepID=A0A2J8A3P3_9CHLO|nr:hypothetical protein TSOC_006404 [Tetrabaena socialis]|eukprot:PNH07149.1 hypothetical protein TSOC_006404 [Tetrabaena socialis]
MATVLYAWAGAVWGVAFGMWTSGTHCLEIALVFLLDQWSKREELTKPEPRPVASVAPVGLQPVAADPPAPPAPEPLAAAGQAPLAPLAAAPGVEPAAPEPHAASDAGAPDPACEPAVAGGGESEDPTAPLPPAAEGSWASEEPAVPAAAACNSGEEGAAAAEAHPPSHPQVAPPAADFEFRPSRAAGLAAASGIACGPAALDAACAQAYSSLDASIAPFAAPAHPGVGPASAAFPADVN